MTARDNLLRAIRLERPDFIPMTFAINQACWNHDDDARLWQLIEMVEAFNCQFVQKWMALEPDMMSYPEDLGMQVGPMLSPDHFRRFIKPVYKRIMKPACDRGCIVHMHSDGDIRTLVDDLIDGGVDVINLQDLVNGIDWIADRFAV